MIVADIKIIPVGTGTSMGDYVKDVYKLFDDSGVSYLPGPMSTSVEMESMDDLLGIVGLVNDLLAEKGVKRIMITLNIDNRLDKENSIAYKLGEIGEEGMKDHIKCRGI